MKKKSAEKQTLNSGSVLSIKYTQTDFEQKYSRYFWIIIPVLAILYYSYRKIAMGFYQDDEVAQYINMIQFWHDPWVILGNGPKPGYKIFMVIPALISYDAVLITNSLIAASTVYLTYLMIRAYNVSYGIIGALLLASQPLFVDLSFRSYSEIFTALCLVTFLLLYKRDKFLIAALLLGYIYTVRQEIALLIIIIGIIFLRKKQYKEAAALIVFPILYNLLGFVKTGDPLFVLTEMRSVAGLNYKSQGLMHYFKVYIFIVGPVCMTLFMAGFFGFLNNTSKIKEYFSKYFLFYVIFLSVFVIQMLTMINDGPNPGNWRYLLHISPICAFFAAVGLNNMSVPSFKNTNYIITGIFAVLVFLFLSKATDGFMLLEKTEYIKLGFVAGVFLLSIIIPNKSRISYLNTFSVLVVLLAFIHLSFVEPKKLSPENIAVKEAAAFIDSLPGIKDRQKLTNHTFIQFYSSQYKDNPGLFGNINSTTIKNAPKGTYIIYESHYGHRPEFRGYDNLPYDVDPETLQKDSSFKFLKEIISSDRKFGVLIFEKQ